MKNANNHTYAKALEQIGSANFAQLSFARAYRYFTLSIQHYANAGLLEDASRVAGSLSWVVHKYMKGDKKDPEKEKEIFGAGPLPDKFVLMEHSFALAKQASNGEISTVICCRAQLRKAWLLHSCGMHAAARDIQLAVAASLSTLYGADHPAVTLRWHRAGCLSLEIAGLTAARALEKSKSGTRKSSLTVWSILRSTVTSNIDMTEDKMFHLEQVPNCFHPARLFIFPMPYPALRPHVLRPDPMSYVRPKNT